MNLILAYHSTARRHREGIQQHGLLPNLPNDAQLYGIYVFHGEFDHHTIQHWKGIRREFRCRWEHRPDSDLWEVAYCGPMAPDQFVENGMVFHHPVSPASVMLVTGHN